MRRSTRSDVVAPRPARSRCGAALPGTIVALAVIGLLAAALATETRTAASAATGALAERRATDAARTALHEALRDWSASGLDSLAVGRSIGRVSAPAEDLARTLRTTRLDAASFALDAEAVVQRAGGRVLARRAARLLVALEPLLPTPRAAVTVDGTIDVDGATLLDGTDTLPAGWPCDASDTASVAALGYEVDAVRYRLPPAPRPPRFAAATRADSLAPLGGASLPLVHVPGDLALVGRAGQGVLVVDGDLTLAGGAELWGVVVVGGTLRAHGPHRIVGAVLARGRPGVAHEARGLRVRWSSCVVAAALRAAGTVRPVTARALTATP